MRETKPTIQDIANIAKVSSTTVSLVLHNREGVGEATREAILKIAEDLGYRIRRRTKAELPSQAPTAERNVVMLVGDNYFFSGEVFYSKIFNGVIQMLEQEGVRSSIATITEAQLGSGELPLIVRQKQADGILIAGDLPEGYFDMLAQAKLPTVILGYECAKYPWFSVDNDNLHGAELAVEHLTGLGHTQIACLATSMQLSSIRERVDGYMLALSKKGIASDPTLHFFGNVQPTIEHGYEMTQKVLKSKKKFTALFAATDALAIGAIKALSEAGLSVPGDVSVAGFDNIEWSSHTNPPLTSVNVHRRHLGHVAALCLLSLMNHDTAMFQSHTRTIVPVDLVVRESTAPLK